MKRSRCLRSTKGSLLIFVFFILVFSGIFSLSLGYMVRQKINVVSRLETRQKLRLLGEAAVQKAVHVLLDYFQKSTLQGEFLNQPWSRNEEEFREVKVGTGEFTVSYTSATSSGAGREPEIVYGLVDEERKINLNIVQSREVLRRLFQGCGKLSRDEAGGMVDSLIDWRDEDDDTSLSGAESGHYKGLNPPYAPRNEGLRTLRELFYLKGMTQELYERVLPYVTLESSGLVNVNTASRAVLFAVGFDPAICDKILAFRRGNDRVEGTEDDEGFTDVSSMGQVLASEGYLYDNEQSELNGAIASGLLTVRSQNFSVQAVARLDRSRQELRVHAVIDETGAIKCWEEEFTVQSS